jgi:hypothetical protein
MTFWITKRFDWDVGEEDEAIPKEGNGARGSRGATEPSSQRKPT